MKQFSHKLVRLTVLICLLFLFVASTGSVAAQSSGFVDVDANNLNGSGTAGDPYIITNASELQSIEDAPDAEYELGTNIDASGTTNWNNGKGFAPINQFNGKINGSNKTITGLTINRSINAGLFAIVGSNGIITDLHLQNVDITAREAGGLATSNNGVIRNSSVNGNISSKIVTGNNVGGLVDENKGLIVSSNVSGSVSGGTGVGGLVGDNNKNGAIKNSYVTADVTAKNNNVGGLVGANGGLITNTSTTATVKANLTDGFNTGGLVGINGKTDTSGTIRHSYALGDIKGDTYVGGLVGRNFNGSIRRSYAVGAVQGNSGTGGLAGRNSGTITDSYWNKQTSRQDSSGGGTGLTTSEMVGSAAQNSMVGFDFGTVWQTNPTAYPTLTSLPQAPASSSRSPRIIAPRDGKYDPNKPHTIGTAHNAIGTIAIGDVGVRLRNVTAGNNTVVASNTSRNNPVRGLVNVTTSAGKLSGDVQVETQLYNTSSGSVEATDTINLTAMSGPGDLTGDGRAATDPDNDGIYEDINGDGSADLRDLQPFFALIQPSTTTPQDLSLDFSGDGQINLQDLQPFFDEVRP